MKFTKAILGLLLLFAPVFVGCDSDSGGGGEKKGDVISSPAMFNIRYISNGRELLELNNGFALMIKDAALVVQRLPSCSGFDKLGAGAISVGDAVEYSWDESKSDTAARVLYATRVKVYKRECLTRDPTEEEPPFQFILDSDHDEIADTSDNCINTHNPFQEDTDGDGTGDACDADPNDPNVQ